MSKVKYICVSGYKNSGKDTFTKLAINKGATRYAMGDPLKEALKAIFMFSDEQLNDSKLKELNDERWGLSPREAMKIIGTELLQIDIHNYFPKNKLTFLRDIFVKRFQLWEKEQKDLKVVVISDLRFDHEYEFFKKQGAKFILIDRPSINKNDDHQSETSFNNFSYDYTILNDKTVVDFFIECENVLKKIL